MLKSFWKRVSKTFGKKRSMLILVDLAYYFISAFLITFVIPFEQTLIHPYILQLLGIIAWVIFVLKIERKYEEGFFIDDDDE